MTKAKPESAAPLTGTRVLVTRARSQAAELSGELRQLGATVLEIPFIEIRDPASFDALDSVIRSISNYDWLILTSVNGVRAFFARLEKLGLGEADLLHLNIAAIGPATSQAIEKHGLPVDVVPEEYVAESVVESLRAQVAGRRVLLVRAKVARDVIPNELRTAGARVHVVEAYETVVPEGSRKELLAVMGNSSQRPQVITFTSSSTVRNFVEMLGKDKASPKSPLLTGVKLASIGPVTSATLKEVGLHADIEATEYTIAGLVAAIASAAK